MTTTISPEQCRAGRALLDWSQDALATNAHITRSTVADFEANLRKPTKNNLLSIADSMFAAGIQFLPDEDGAGAGVRFRKQQLGYIKTVTIDGNQSARIRMEYAAKPFVAVIPREVMEDYHRTNFKTDEEFSRAVSEMLHHILASVEVYMRLDGGLRKDGTLIVDRSFFDPALQ